MVITRVDCGLGNQLFQYAVGRRLATKRGVLLKLDLGAFASPLIVPGLEAFTRSYQLSSFNIDAEVASPAEIARFRPRPLHKFDPRRIRGPWWRFRQRYLPSLCRGAYIREQSMNFQPHLLQLPGEVYLEGWWQSEGYFHDIAETLKKDFTLRDSEIEQRAREAIAALRQPRKPLVAVHVRRGDVARAHEVLKDISNVANTLLPVSYFNVAMARFSGARFLVFSESGADLDWCRAHVHADDIEYVGGGSDLDDFSMMQMCDHNIISNSTFSWWAAWLNPNPLKRVVAPRAWFRPSFAPSHDIRSLIPERWTLE